MSLQYDAARFASPDDQERWFATLARTIAVDFDGTLHPYTRGWTGSEPDDEPPIAGAEEFLAWCRESGYRVVVFSTRCGHAEGLQGVEAWLERYGLADLVDDATCQKVAAVAYVDDRAVPFTGSWGPVRANVERLASGRTHGAAQG